MTDGSKKHPGVNLGPAHGDDDKAAERLLFGFWVFMMSDTILFGMVFASYVTSVGATAGGPDTHALYDIGSVFLQTMLLLISSMTFGMASLAMKYQRGALRLGGWLVLTLALGVAFLGFELRDFMHMAAQGGVPSRSGFLSAFFDLVPLHGLHVLAACLWLVCLLGQWARYGLDRETKLGLLRMALFWHFLDLVWIGIFSVVYLAGLI